MPNPAAEKYLKQVRKLPSNLHCPNCGSESTTNLGFGNVCVKFKTFICDLCKTSHQAISHRVKSVSMSEWTMEEVRELTAERSGGNAAALHTWLLNAPAIGRTYPGGKRPKKGDDVNVFKQFIMDCYEHGKFRAETPFDPASVTEEISSPTTVSASTSPRPMVPSPVPRAHPGVVPVRRTNRPAAAPAPVAAPAAAPAAPVVNLLDMSDDPLPAAEPPSTSLSVATDGFFGSDTGTAVSGGFDAFTSPNPNSAESTDFDAMFGSSVASMPAPSARDVSTSSAPGDVFSSGTTATSAPQRSVSAPVDPFADFGGSGVTTGGTTGAGAVNSSSTGLNAMAFGGTSSANGLGGMMGSSSGVNTMRSNGMNGMGNSMGGGMSNSMGRGMGNSMGGGMGNSMGGGVGNSMGGGMGNSMGRGMGSSMGGGMSNSMGRGMGNSMGGGMGNAMGGGMGNSMGGGMANSMGGGMGNSMGSGMGNSMGGGMGNSMGANNGRGGQGAAVPSAGNSNISSMMSNQLAGMNSMKSNSYVTAQSQGAYGGAGYGSRTAAGGANSNVFDFVNNEMKKK